MKRWRWLPILAIAAMSLAQATPTFTINPTGQQAGLGQTVGWGFEADDDTFYLVPVASDYCLSFNTTTDALPCQPPPYDANPVPGGTYTDYITNPPYVFFVSAPGTPDTSQQTFSPGVSGIGQFVINNDPTLVGQTLSGVIVLEYNLYSCDPTSCDDAVEETNSANNSLDFFVTAEAQIQVVPEPATLGLTAVALLLGLVRRRRRAERKESGI